jgi:hypothetical protein
LKQIPTNKLEACGAFSVPALSDEVDSLDDLLLDLDLMRVMHEASFELEDRKALKANCIALDRRFAEWQDSRVPEFQPIVTGHIKRRAYESEIAVGYWQGKVHTYLDLYVASAWNIFRAARLLLLTLIIKLSGTLGSDESYVDHLHTTNRIVEDIVASVPYHLVDNLPGFLSKLAASTEITDPGRPLGGLLLMHPLYVASKTPFLSRNIREYMRKCLKWIGSNMGLAQATLLAMVREARYLLLKSPT